MIRLLLLFFILISFQFHSFSQNCESNRYQEAVFSTVDKTEDLVYSTADVYDVFNLPIEFDFKLDVYEPAGDVLEKRPLVIMSFGGAYIFGDKEHADMIAWCDSLARYGYVAVSIDYRLGVNALSEGSAVRAMYRGVQDTRAAIRYMLEHQTEYRIDPDYIYLGGESAGAINSLHAAFMTTEVERPSETNGILLENFDLGCLDCSGNNFQQNFDIKGIIDLWGGVIDLNLISANESIPTLIIHGEDDFIVPYDEGFPFVSQFQLTFPYLYASKAIHEHMDNLGIYNEYYTYPGEGHLFYGLPDGIITFPNEQWNPVWTQGHEFLYRTLEFTTETPSGNTSVMAGLPYTYSIPFNDNSTYCWSITGGTITTDNGHEITVEWNNGGGNLTVIEKNCLDVVGAESEALIVNTTVSNSNIEAIAGIKVYPTIIEQGEEIIIESAQFTNDEVKGSLIDASGKQYYTFTLKENNIIPTNDLGAGVYFISLQMNNQVGTYRLLVK